MWLVYPMVRERGHRAGAAKVRGAATGAAGSGNPKQCFQNGVKTWKGFPDLFRMADGSKSSAGLSANRRSCRNQTMVGRGAAWPLLH